MAIDAFLNFTKSTNSPPKGESEDAMFGAGKTKYEVFHVKTFTFAVNNKGSAGTGGGAGTGKAEFDDFEFSIDTQYGSALLMKHCAKGTPFETVILHVRKAGTVQREFLRYVFGNCIISSYSTSGDEESTDTVKFNYRSLHTCYFPQKDDGTLNKDLAKSEGGYDLKLNAEWPDGPSKCADMQV